MKRHFFVAILLVFQINLFSQSAKDYSVLTWAEIGESPAKIVIHWNEDAGADSYTVYKKMKSAVSWGAAVATLPSDSTAYVDIDVEKGLSYEYKIEKSGNVAAFGYINAGIEIDPVHSRGRILVLVDDRFSFSLGVDIHQLTEDLIADGWIVARREVSMNASVDDIKQIILDEYFNDPNRLEAVFCLGHIPVPYSGVLAPDGHTNNHNGAWPADGYYGDINGNWTDLFANNSSAGQERNHNVPGDGKFDQDYFASDIELQVGRVDFYNMPAFSESEEELLRRYLKKDHAYKIGEIEVLRRGVIDDNFGGFGGEAFAGSGWKSFAPMLHPDSIITGDYRMSMDTSSYMWSYGCGAGSYTSCNGVGRTSDFAVDSLNGIFSCLFGSYFGDWDSSNNLLRASIAQGTILTNCWSGRPHWYFHHMGLGENIGYSARLSMNNNGVQYFTPLSFLSRIVSMGLMGDPSLRMHIIETPEDLSLSFDGADVDVNWLQSSDPDVKYYVYRSTDRNMGFELLNEQAISGNSYSDECIGSSGKYYYMVRATKLERTPSGSYHNLSLGVMDDLELEIDLPEADFMLNVNMDSLTTQNTSSNANTWMWDFGDGTMSNEFEPVHSYEMPGEYLVKLVVSNECFQDSTEQMVSVILSSSDEIFYSEDIKIYPNPGYGQYFLQANTEFRNAELKLFDSFGRLLKISSWDSSSSVHRLSLNDHSSGLYFILITDGTKQGIFSLYKL